MPPRQARAGCGYPCWMGLRAFQAVQLSGYCERQHHIMILKAAKRIRRPHPYVGAKDVGFCHSILRLAKKKRTEAAFPQQEGSPCD